VSPANVACVILASGLSERFGAADKLSADLCGKPVLAHVLDMAQAVGFGDIFCVSKAADIDSVELVKNDYPEYGQGHALRLGLAAVQKSGWEICVILLGDMPLVTSSYIKTLIGKIQENQCVVSSSESIRMPPAIFNAAAMDIILAQETALGARDLFDLLKPETLELDAFAAHDVDTPADLARVMQMMKARKI